MIKKVVKTCTNPHGMVNTPVDFSRPIIIGFFPEDHNYRELNGYLNKIMYLLQIRHSDSIDSHYDLADIPFDIIAYEREDLESFTKLLESIPENNKEDAKRMLRNINIVSYCDGHNKTRIFLNSIYNTLAKKHYSKEETEEIMHSIFVLEIVHNLSAEGKLCRFAHVNSVIFHDVDDYENTRYKGITIDNKKQIVLHNNPSKKESRLFLYKSFGEGSLASKQREHEFSRDYIYAPIMNAYMAIILINAMKSSLNHTELDIEKLLSNLSLIQKLIEEYQKENPKDFSQYTKEDIQTLNIFIMSKIQPFCLQELNLRLLSEKEYNYLNQKDSAIKKYLNLGINNRIRDILWGIQNIIDQIINYNEKHDKNEEIEVFVNNMPVSKKVSDVILSKIDELIKRINEFFTYIEITKLPDDFTLEIRHEYHDYIENVLSELKKILKNPKLLQIINEYNISDEVFENNRAGKSNSN